MPSTSEKQHRMFQAIAHSPAFAKKVGIKQSVGKDFMAADMKAGKYANGGAIDNIPIMATKGEYMLPKDTAKAVGKKKLDKLVKATHTPVKMADGGAVLAQNAYAKTLPPAGIQPIQQPPIPPLDLSTGRPATTPPAGSNVISPYNITIPPSVPRNGWTGRRGTRNEAIYPGYADGGVVDETAALLKRRPSWFGGTSVAANPETAAILQPPAGAGIQPVVPQNAPLAQTPYEKVAADTMKWQGRIPPGAAADLAKNPLAPNYPGAPGSLLRSNPGPGAWAAPNPYEAEVRARIAAGTPNAAGANPAPDYASAKPGIRPAPLAGEAAAAEGNVARSLFARSAGPLKVAAGALMAGSAIKAMEPAAIEAIAGTRAGLAQPPVLTPQFQKTVDAAGGPANYVANMQARIGQQPAQQPVPPSTVAPQQTGNTQTSVDQNSAPAIQQPPGPQSTVPYQPIQSTDQRDAQGNLVHRTITGSGQSPDYLSRQPGIQPAPLAQPPAPIGGYGGGSPGIVPPPAVVDNWDRAMAMRHNGTFSGMAEGNKLLKQGSDLNAANANAYQAATGRYGTLANEQAGIRSNTIQAGHLDLNRMTEADRQRYQSGELGLRQQAENRAGTMANETLKDKKELRDLTNELTSPGITPERERQIRNRLLYLHGKEPRQDRYSLGQNTTIDPVTMQPIHTSVVLNTGTGELRRGLPEQQAQIPPGMVRQVGTSGGKPVYEDAQGKRFGG